MKCEDFWTLGVGAEKDLLSRHAVPFWIHVAFSYIGFPRGSARARGWRAQSQCPTASLLVAGATPVGRPSLSSPERPTLAPQLSPTTFLHGLLSHRGAPAILHVAKGRAPPPLNCRACILQYSTVESPRPGRKSTMCHTEFRILPIDRNDSEPTPAREANDGGDAGSRRRHSSAPGLGRFEMDEDAFQVVCGGAFAVAQQACKRSLSTSPHRARLQPRSA